MYIYVYHVCVHDLQYSFGWYFHIDFFLFSLMAPIAKDQYGWSSEDATLYVNVISAGTSVFSVMGFIGLKFMVKW